MKTNELDEILDEFGIKGLLSELHTEAEIIEFMQDLKQQINKWALEKCLRVIDMDIYFTEGFKVFNKEEYISVDTFKKTMENFSIEVKERARKEFE